MSEVKIIINGGNNQILPNATQATQIFHGSVPAGEQTGMTSENEEQQKAMNFLTIYINKDNLPHYLAQMGQCQTASELALVVMSMVDSEPKLTPELMVKAQFIKQLLPFAPMIAKGNTVDNVRQRINDAWTRRPRLRR